MANSWPSTLPIPEGIEETLSKPTQSSSNLTGYTEHSQENVITTKTFNISWGMLTSTEKETLITFFADNMGGNFSWTHPVSETDYTVVFVDDTLTFKYVGKDTDGVSYYSTSLSLLTHDPILPVPVNVGVPVIDGTIFEGDTISVISTGTWLNNPSTYIYQWYRDGKAILGANSGVEYVLTSIDINTIISFGVISTNNSGSSDEVFSNTITTTPVTFTAKSIIFDIADNWGYYKYTGVRSIDFYTDGGIGTTPQIISMLYNNNDYEAYATTKSAYDVYAPQNAFDTSLSKINDANEGSWFSYRYIITNQRLIIVFDQAIDFKYIVINNSHEDGGNTTFGIKNIKIYYSSNEITDTTYGASISSSNLLFDGQVREHIASNTIDNQWLSLIQ